MEEHYYGGAWTEIKLDVLRDYLDFYTTALGEKGFELIYIDACAGTGSRAEIVPDRPMLGQKEQTVYWDGSPRIALKIKQQFDHYLFIENTPKRFQELEKIKGEFPNVNIQLKNDDANKVITELARKPIWDQNKYRGVIFFDPYGMEITKVTLSVIAETESFNVWYLFPLSGVVRQAAKKN